MAILGLAPKRHRPVHTQAGEDAWREVRPLRLALALGHLAGQGLRLGTLVLAPDTAGGRITVPRAALQAKPRSRSDGTGGAEPHRAEVVEASEDPARGIVVQGRRGHGLA